MDFTCWSSKDEGRNSEFQIHIREEYSPSLNLQVIFLNSPNFFMIFDGFMEVFEVGMMEEKREEGDGQELKYGENSKFL